MAQIIISFEEDEDLKNSFEQVCTELGLSMETAITLFIRAVIKENQIPFELSAEPFYSESNVAHLRRGIAAINAGKGVEHGLIEVEGYPEIISLFKVLERRKMTVGELIDALQEYPHNSVIRLNISNEPRQFLEIKDISPVVDMDTNQAHPVLNIDKIKIVQKP